jgi:hypothetical protein
VIGARNIMTTVESLFSSSCLFQVDGYCIDVPWGMFSYIEKPINLADIIADEVFISDWVNDNSINFRPNTLFYQLLTYGTYLGDSLGAFFYVSPDEVSKVVLSDDSSCWYYFVDGGMNLIPLLSE